MQTQAAPCDPLLDGIPMPTTPTPITHWQHLKLDPEIESTVDALQDFLRKFDTVREITDRAGLTVEQIHELAAEASEMLGCNLPLLERSSRLHAALKALARAGLKTDAIGRLVGLSRLEVVARLSHASLTDEQAQKRCDAEELAYAGVHKSDIADAVDLDYDSVCSWLRNIGQYRPEKPRNSQRIPGRDRCLELMAEGLQNAEIVSVLRAEGLTPVPSKKAIATWRHRFHNNREVA